MQILLDTANVETIRRYNDIYNISGVTSNPTIISREKADFFKTLCCIREIIGEEKQLHVQVTASTFEEMLKEAECIVKKLGMNTYIKVPANEVGIKTIKILKQNGYNVTATAIYSLQQAMLAASVGADYVAPYFNRMCNCNYDMPSVISDMVKLYEVNSLKTKLLVASFKNTNQILQALLAGAQAVTASPELYSTMLESPNVESAIDIFTNDWVKTYANKRIYELN